jgi:peptidoglycan hydrolase-like protein with peptidoglycan-binding domain
MPLVSKIFKGDAKLEACLVNHSAHITQGAVGEHVSRIQTALLLLDASKIKNDERVARHYGASTAAAVLAYKTKRQIINRSYETQADNIVGKMTISALDSEMFQLELASHDRHCCAGMGTRPIRR